MKDLRRQPAFIAKMRGAQQKGRKNPPCRPGHPQTKEKFIASALRSVNALIFADDFGVFDRDLQRQL